MNKIINAKKAYIVAGRLHAKNKTIVLVGGCFDILHLGHIRFLKSAKKKGDKLFVLLESDETVKRTKGEKRPINAERDRAEVLSGLESVDFIVVLKPLKSNKEYDTIVFKIKPDIIATTKGDPNISHKKRQARHVNAKLELVLDRISDISTTRLEKLLSK